MIRSPAEVLRLEPPVKSTPRWTMEPMVVDGVALPKDSEVRLDVCAVNRGGNAHRSFGGGAYYCLGSHLASVELAVLVEEWLGKQSRWHSV